MTALRQRRPREHDNKHLDFIRSLPCICCKDNIATEAAHVKYSDDRAAKERPGISQKADDCWTLPLCGTCHSIQHDMPEREFWKSHAGLDPIFYCMALARVSGDYAAGTSIVAMAR